ncbi:hypothetical protein CDD83_9388 [Cordyceps sp. RAO-2017]|nr:hypothetical protein CDD83_9388 [Cordyceps sp. RAO-2017]
MALLNPTFLLGLVVLTYLSSFVVFAVIRILTGVSIQRIGYLSLRRIAYTPRDGVRIELRSLGLNIHRPTFAQPTWISLVLSELVVTVDMSELQARKQAEAGLGQSSESESVPLSKTPPSCPDAQAASGGEAWRQVAKIKDRLKRLHRNIKWLRMIDVVATNSTVNVVGVGDVQVGSFTVAVDTRRKIVDHARLFHKLHPRKRENRQAEWIFTVRSLLFTADGKDSLEVLDHALLNVHGFLYESRDGLRDATVALKLGRVHVPYDDIQQCAAKLKQLRRGPKTLAAEAPRRDLLMGPVTLEGDGEPAGRNDDLMQTISDSKELFSSILRNIKAVQFAVSFAGLTKRVTSVKPASSPILLNASMKEVGIDVHRLNPKSPAHRMYFPSTDIAHQALAAALSISVGLDDGHGKPARLLYIPMATTTARTTLPSKTVQLAHDGSLEKNANILFANSVVTSPSVDLDPGHLPLLIAMMQPKPKPPKAHHQKRHHLISRLLPKANVKFSMHEPVVRIKLQPLQDTEDPDDFDLIISSISSVSLDVESSHSSVEDMHYFLDGAMRLQSHRLYYQTCSGEILNLITTESLDLKAHLGASPDVCLDVTGHIQSASVSMVRQEITDGLRQIVRQLHIDVEPEKRASSKTSKHQNFLRSMPEWLVRYHFEASDFTVEVAGVDEDISDDTRGICLHLDSFSAEYRAHRLDGPQRRPPRRRTHSRSINQSDSDLTASPSSPRLRRKPQNVGDGRRLALHARGLEVQIVEAADRLEVEPFVSIPRLELAFSASSDSHGPMFHIQSLVRTIMLQYSLYRHYSVGVAVMTLRKAFLRTGRDTPRPRQQGTYLSPDRIPTSPGEPEADGVSTITHELLTVDIKASMVQLKAEMPHEPLLMFHAFGLEGGRHRWSTPFASFKLARLYVEPPRMRHVWAKLVSIKHGRVDLRESRHKTSLGGFAEEKMIDVATEAIRFAIPHEVIFSRITDNIINVFKAVLQLHHRFKTGTNEYILDKHPEGPKLVPKISIRSRNFLFELEDGAFEWKLGIIYRTGRVEQTQRLAREEAFRVKSNRVREEASRRGSKVRSRSALARGRTENSSSSAWFRSRSLDSYQPDGQGGLGRWPMPRYDPDGESQGINGHAKVSEVEAQAHLDLLNSQSWKKRIDRAYKESQSRTRDMRGAFWGNSSIPDDVEVTENILEVPQRPALMSLLVSDLHVTLDKPTFAMRDLPEFIHKYGKGMPRDMLYTLLIPMHVAIGMGEARMSLRDYPLPLLHIPALKAGQSSRVPAVTLKTNFVIAEEFRGPESTRRIMVNVIPPRNRDPASSNEGCFAIEVRRTVGAVKSYSDVYMDINSALPTRVTWGPCYQPAIQDMMMVIESFTKPVADPSEQVGFWDKIRLSFHSRIHVAWKGGGDMHLSLKGSRDPYYVLRDGAGFLMCWRSDVRWNINTEPDPKRFMTVDSGEYILAIPDFSHLVREATARREADDTPATDGPSTDGPSTDGSLKGGAQFKKVVMKLSGNVRWMAGLVLERAIVDGKRSFEFKPHYDVILKNPLYAKSEPGLPYDAFRGFRSRHIHMSIAVRSPADRAWTSHDPEPSGSYNSVHLTPRFFTHFFQWWGLFSGPMSLPIRSGNLFPGREKNSKKFGRHLATVKYNLLLAPLFLSHIYKHKDAEDYSENSVSATGLKIRFDSFMLDLHQRREEFNTLVKGKNTHNRTSGIKIHAAQLDLASADIRAVSASLMGTTTEAIKKGSIAALITEQDDKPDLSKFTIPDHDLSWIDMDDFVELDWILPTEPHPETKIMPLAYAPRLTYFRQTDIGGTIGGDPTRTSPFGNEPTHFCLMTHDDDPKLVQARLIQERLDQLEEQMLTHSRAVGEAELKVIQTNSQDHDMVEVLETLRRHTGVLKEKKAFLENMLEQMNAPSPAGGSSEDGGRKRSGASSRASDGVLNIPSTAEFESDFENRFVIHNMQLKWNNLLRNIVLRYIHQNGQRRGFIYYLSRPAIKFIQDLVEEQGKAKSHHKPPKAASTTGASTPSQGGGGGAAERDAAHELEDRIKGILNHHHNNHNNNNNNYNDGRPYSTSTSFEANGDGTCASIEDLESGISKEYSPQRGYHVRLIGPQIQLQSDKNKKHVVLVTAKGMELKVLEVMDKQRISDTVSGLVQRRFLVSMDSTQFFVTHQKWFSTNLVSMYAGSRYGTPRGSSWPPWVPMEIMFSFTADHPVGFRRVVQKTSARLRYDKYNNLRLKYNDEVNTDEGPAAAATAATAAGGEPAADGGAAAECRSDNVWVEFPQARALCNSSQYYAMYVIVLDLLMYSEPLEKTRSERLEKIMLASDFSDLSGAPQMVLKLQQRIKQIEEIKSHFQVYSSYLDLRGWEDRLALERDLAACEDELFFMMKAITTAQRKYEVDSESDANALLRWNISAHEIVWHLMQDSNEALVELQLKDVEYDRTDNSDGSHANLIRVGKVLGLNLLQDATYPEIIGPYHGEDKTWPAQGGLLGDGGSDMIRVYWHMLEAIAGIPVMDRFEVNLFPMRIQLEREAGKRIFSYIFPGMDGEKGPSGSGSGSGRNNSPYMIKHDMAAGQDEDSESLASSSSRLGTPSMDNGAGGGGHHHDSAGFTTKAGSLEHRLRPTLASHGLQHDRSPKRPHGSGGHHLPHLHHHGSVSGGGSGTGGEGHSFKLFRSAGTGKTMLSKKSSHDSLRAAGPGTRAGSVCRSSTGLSSKDGRGGGGEHHLHLHHHGSNEGKKGPARFGLRGKGQGGGGGDDKQQQQQSDDLSKMMTRASNYMTFAHIKMPSVVLCLSYKGKDQRNFEDVHDFVFRLPTIERR